jgi:hypothetical protein
MRNEMNGRDYPPQLVHVLLKIVDAVDTMPSARASAGCLYQETAMIAIRRSSISTPRSRLPDDNDEMVEVIDGRLSLMLPWISVGVPKTEPHALIRAGIGVTQC